MQEHEAEQFFRDNLVVRPPHDQRTYAEIYQRFQRIGAVPVVLEHTASTLEERRIDREDGGEFEDSFYETTSNDIEFTLFSRIPEVRRMARADEFPATCDGAFRRNQSLATAIARYQTRMGLAQEQ